MCLNAENFTVRKEIPWSIFRATLAFFVFKAFIFIIDKGKKQPHSRVNHYVVASLTPDAMKAFSLKV